MKPFVELDQVSLRYGGEADGLLALDRVDLTIGEGEFVAVVGPSGCGKSTLLNLLGMLDTPSGGQYHFAGEEVSSYNEKQRAFLRKSNIGFVFQSFNLIDELSVYENIELPLLYLKTPTGERKELTEKIMAQMELTARRNHFPQQLSGGQQQRVAVARAVVSEPKLILADEPTGNLDSKNGDEVMGMLTDLNEQGTTIVMVTHSDVCANQSKRIIQLLDGDIVGEDVPARDS